MSFAIAGVAAVPPQARGWTIALGEVITCCPGSPAGAGIDLAVDWPGHERHGFPRRRGDRPAATVAQWLLNVVPPQARG